MTPEHTTDKCPTCGSHSQSMQCTTLQQRIDGYQCQDTWHRPSTQPEPTAENKPSTITLHHTRGPQDWQDTGENANYMNQCSLCRWMFWGHKHRVVCRTCTEKAAREETGAPQHWAHTEAVRHQFKDLRESSNQKLAESAKSVIANPPAQPQAAEGQREAFEKWAHDYFTLTPTFQWDTTIKQYEPTKVHHCWRAWTAAQSASAPTAGAGDERGSFEAAMMREGYQTIADTWADGIYQHGTHQSMWVAWKARAKLAASAPTGEVEALTGCDVVGILRALHAASAPTHDTGDGRELSIAERIQWLHTEKGLADARLAAVQRILTRERDEARGRVKTVEFEHRATIDSRDKWMAEANTLTAENKRLTEKRDIQQKEIARLKVYGEAMSKCFNAADEQYHESPRSLALANLEKSTALTQKANVERELFAAKSELASLKRDPDARVKELEAEAAELKRKLECANHAKAEFVKGLAAYEDQVLNLEAQLSSLQWVSVSDRLPTKEDGDDCGVVMWAWEDHGTRGVTQDRWDTRVPTRTHWRTIDLPKSEPYPAQQAKEAHTGCPLDTDGDGNCPIHPKGCPTTDPLAAVKAHFAKGGKVQWRGYGEGQWTQWWDKDNNHWSNSKHVEYRIHPDDLTPTRETCQTCGSERRVHRQWVDAKRCTSEWHTTPEQKPWEPKYAVGQRVNVPVAGAYNTFIKEVVCAHVYGVGKFGARYDESHIEPLPPTPQPVPLRRYPWPTSRDQVMLTTG